MADSDITVTLSTGIIRVNNKIRPKTYTVVKGDNIYKIARKVYGDGAKWGELYEKNADVLLHPCLIPEGTILYL